MACLYHHFLVDASNMGMICMAVNSTPYGLLDWLEKVDTKNVLIE
jgi:hypothetical protein